VRLHTILLADDQPELREVVSAILSDGGHTVLTASDGYEALRLLAEHWVSLLITDVKMPGIDGFALARQAKVMRPNIHVIYISGYASGPEQSAGPTYGEILNKPVRAGDLVEAVERALA
jgi:CheY-like chemotaxis protein